MSSSSFRKEAQFERARWRRALVLPVWALQIGLLLSLIGIFAYRLANTIEDYEDRTKKGELPIVEVVWECTNIGLSVLSLLLTLVEVSKLFSETLTPFFMLASHVIKLTCAFCNLAMDIVVHIKYSEQEWSTIGLGIDAALLATMIILSIYSIKTYRRVSAFDDYSPPGAVPISNYRNGYSEIEMGGGVASGDVFLRANPYNNVPTAYPSQNTSGSRGRALSAVSATSASASAAASTQLYKTPAPREEDIGDGGRRSSYNHERDTQFDAYRSSVGVGLNKEEIDHAISSELWGSSAVPAQRNSGPGVPAIIRSDSVVGAGMVANSVSQAREGQVVRTTSWSVEHGQVVLPPGAAEVISTIEEGYEEEVGMQGGHGRPKNGDDDRALLLGNARSGGFDDSRSRQPNPPYGSSHYA